MRRKLPIDGVTANTVYLKLKKLIEAFDSDRLKEYPTHFPNCIFRELRFDASEESFRRCASFTFRVMGVDTNRVKIAFVNTEEARELYARFDGSRRPEGTYSNSGAAGIYSATGITDPEQGIIASDAIIVIDMLRFVGASVTSMIATLAHECAHHRIFAQGSIDRQDEEMADLLPVLHGLGVFSTNSALEYRTDGDIAGAMAWHSWEFHRLGYLSQEAFAFALALTSTWKGESASQLKTHLSSNAKSTFLRSIKFLSVNRYHPWEEEQIADEQISLESRLKYEEEQTLKYLANEKPPEIERTDIKWEGTFWGEPIDFKEIINEEFDLVCLDYGERGRTVNWQPDVYFGIGYRIFSNDPDASFKVTEVIELQDETKPLNREVFRTCREIIPRKIQCIGCLIGRAPCLRPGTYYFKVLQNQIQLFVREIAVRVGRLDVQKGE